MTAAKPGEVWELDNRGSRLLYAAGSPEAVAFMAQGPHDLEKPAPDDDPELDIDVPTDAVPTHPDDPKPVEPAQEEN